MVKPPLDPDSFPSLRNISAAFIKRLGLVPTERPARREYVYVPVPIGDYEGRGSAIGFWAEWGMTWESGAYRVSYFEPDELRRYVPEALAARLEKECNGFELHLVPAEPGGRHYAYEALYHLLPLRTLRRFKLPVRERGVWPPFPGWRGEHAGTASENTRLRQAFAHHVWPLLSPASRMGSFSATDSLTMLAHDLDYWFPHLDRAIEERLGTLSRCEISKDDDRAIWCLIDATHVCDKPRTPARRSTRALSRGARYSLPWTPRSDSHRMELSTALRSSPAAM